MHHLIVDSGEATRGWNAGLSLRSVVAGADSFGVVSEGDSGMAKVTDLGDAGI